MTIADHKDVLIDSEGGRAVMHDASRKVGVLLPYLTILEDPT
jgi:hypothetical protein